MKKITLLLLLLVTSWQINAQVSINQGFEAATTPAGWTYVSFSRTTTTPCVGVASVRRNFWSSGLAGSVTSQNYAAASNGAQIDVSFDWKSEEYSAGDGVGVNMDVQYSTDNGVSWTTFGNVTTTAVTTCATWSASIPAGTVLNGSDFKLKFDGTHTGGDCYFYIDNIIATQATSSPPNCTVLSTPTNGATSISSSTVSWTAATGAPTGYRLNVGTTPGGTTVLNNFDVANVLSYNLGTLLAGTTYYVTVIPYNVNGNATGCTESSFTTCSAYTIPYFEGFEAGYTHNTPVAGCLLQESTTGTSVWTANASLTTYNRAPRTGTYNAFLQYGNEDWIFIPINLVGGTSYTASLFARQDDVTATDADVTISYGTAANAAGMINTIVAATGIINGGYQQIIGSFTPASTGTYYVGIKGFMNGAPWYISLDDISIEVTPACANPLGLVASAITDASATTTWTATTGNYEYVLDTNVANPAGSGTTLAGETYNATLLSPSTTYYFHVRSVCAGPTYSTWSTVSFTTACAAVTAFTENFDGAVAPAFPNCWARVGTGGNANIQATNPSSGINTMYLYSPSTTSLGVVKTIPVSNLGAGTHRLNFKMRGNFTAGDDVEVGYLTDPNDAASFVALGTVNAASLTYADYTFIPPAGVYSNYLAFRHTGTISASVLIDDVVWEPIPACNNPSGIAVSLLTSVSATVTWAATTGNYEYVLDNAVANPAGSGTVLAGETYNSTPLTPSTLYYFHVRSVCAGPSYSTWSTVSFTTLATPPVNDDCLGAIELIPAGDFATGAITGTLVGATSSEVADPLIPSPGCASYIGNDIWYKATVPASGSITFETGDSPSSAITDTGMAIYSGTCGALVLALCDDDTSLNGAFSLITLSGATTPAVMPGDILYARAWRYGSTSTNRNILAAGELRIAAYDASLSTRSFDTTGFLAYPNPVKDVLNLSYTTPISSVSVHNLLGQEVITKSINATQSKIDMSNLSNGTYLVKVTVDGLVKTLKVVKQ